MESPYLIRVIVKQVKFLKRNKCPNRSTGYTTPTNLLKEFEFNSYLAINVEILLLFEQALEYVYGEDWSPSKLQYNWTKGSLSSKISNLKF